MLRVGDRVVLVAIPPGLLDGLPAEDQRAIAAIVGQPVSLLGYDDESGKAELHFTTGSSRHTTIWVSPEFVRPYSAD